MSTINPSLRGIVQDGKVVFSSGGLPEGTVVLLTPGCTPPYSGGATDTPEGFAAWLRWYESLELNITDEERAMWKAAAQEQRRFELSSDTIHLA